MGVDDYVQLILTSTAELPGKLNKIFIDTLMKANIWKLDDENKANSLSYF